MRASYLLRFDDICPTMNWVVWEQLELMLRGRGIKPALAVIPDNKDSSLWFAESRPDFWDRVRQWQSWGWTIGIHGYQHLYESRDRGLVGLARHSEFAGLPAQEQHNRVAQALAIFAQQNVRADCFIAPGHSFDETTIKVLLEAGVDVISDGFFLYPGRDAAGILWVPQQLWRIRRMPFGVWTVCLHVNSWGPAQVDSFRALLAGFGRDIGSFSATIERYNERVLSRFDRIEAAALKSLAWMKTRFSSGAGCNGRMVRRELD